MIQFDDNPEAQVALKIIKYSDDSLFLTGKAGTGKSTLLRYLISDFRKNFVILAPTGIAALNVGGQTIHSFFQLEPRPYLPKDRDINELSDDKRTLIKNLDIIIIDEVSMVRADMLNAVDLSLRKNTGVNAPFGGKKMLFIGDLFQLPPVLDSRNQEEVNIVAQNYETPYFFSAKALENSKLKYHIVELTKIYRQKDKAFIDLLNNVRSNSVNQSHIDLLNSKYCPNFIQKTNDYSLILATTNDIVNTTNSDRINSLPGDFYSFEAQITGDFLRNGNTRLPTDRLLNLKIGAQIMFIKNDQEKKWVNGTLGKITSIDNLGVKVKVNQTNEEYRVGLATWENFEYIWNKEEHTIEKKVTGTFTQYPLKLAWAVTIHKSQGQTFNNVIIDLGRGAFATGQTYVALSRCTSFGGIILKSRVNYGDILVDERVKQFMSRANTSEKAKEKGLTLYYGLSNSVEKLDQEVKSFEEKLKIQLELTNQLNNEISTLTSLLENTKQLLLKSENNNETLTTKLKDQESKLNSKVTNWQTAFGVVIIGIIAYFTFHYLN